MGKMSDAEFEGTLLRKQEWESTTKKTPCGSRTWIRVYVVLKGRQMNFYNSESAQLTYQKSDDQPTLDLADCTAKVAVDYTKKQHVFRLSLESGAEYLFQAADQEQLNLWVEKINGPSSLPPSCNTPTFLPPSSDNPSSLPPGSNTPTFLPPSSKVPQPTPTEGEPSYPPSYDDA